MKAYKLEVLIIEDDSLSKDEIISEIEENGQILVPICNAGYIWPRVISCEEADIGEWTDDHPLNKDIMSYSKYFPKKNHI